MTVDAVYRFLPPGTAFPTGLIPGQAVSFHGPGVTVIVRFQPEQKSEFFPVQAFMQDFLGQAAGGVRPMTQINVTEPLFKG
jgi:hypothetical protein